MAQQTDARPASRAPVRTVLRRVWRVCRLDASVYGEIENDPRGTWQAAGVVAVVAAAAVLGTIFTGDWHPGAIAGAVLGALIHWLLWGVLIFLVADLLFHAPTQRPAVVRGLGYAQAPQIVAVLGFIPYLGPVLVLASRVLVFLAGHHAMRATLRISRTRIMATTLVCFLITFGVAALVRALLGDVPYIDSLTRP